jgi:hypothetical protein
MYSKLFADHGIQVTEQEVEVRRDSQGLPRLWFRSAGNPLVGLDLTGASHYVRDSKQRARGRLRQKFHF